MACENVNIFLFRSLSTIKEAQKLFGTIPQYLQTYTTLYDLDKEESDRLAKFYIAEKDFVPVLQVEDIDDEGFEVKIALEEIKVRQV